MAFFFFPKKGMRDAASGLFRDQVSCLCIQDLEARPLWEPFLLRGG